MAARGFFTPIWNILAIIGSRWLDQDMKKSILGVVLLCVISLGFLPGCQTKARVDEIKADTGLQLQEHSAMVIAVIASRLDRWILEQNTSGRTPTQLEITLQKGVIEQEEWGHAQKRMAEITMEGGSRVKEAMKGAWGEVVANAPSAIGALAAGNPIGALMLLLTGGSAVGGAAYSASKKHTVKVVAAEVTRADTERSKKYNHGEPFAGIPALAENAAEIMQMLHERKSKGGA